MFQTVINIQSHIYLSFYYNINFVFLIFAACYPCLFINNIGKYIFFCPRLVHFSFTKKLKVFKFYHEFT
ncbi:hypothetical protein BDC45DRAFT_516047 [Circinella umbellata]|nr:hypothetical protein BDC45DRAFT_516047 [Circinella umbellata]